MLRYPCRSGRSGIGPGRAASPPQVSNLPHGDLGANLVEARAGEPPAMRDAQRHFLLLGCSLWLAGCAGGSRQPPPARWTTGFWFWQGSYQGVMPSGETADVLFVQAGTISSRPGKPKPRWDVYGSWEEDLPAAREYWAVFRYDRPEVPDIEVASALASKVAALGSAARERKLPFVGVQLDIDSPTGALSRYAGFLRELRKRLPPGTRVSITALLDWFRGGTNIGDVIEQADEFVPQFYDLAGARDSDRRAAIAARIDAARWGPAFQRFGKPFRIGISTFGRASVLRADRSGSGGRVFSSFRDLRPLDVAVDPAFELQASRNEANETVLSYRAVRAASFGYSRVETGDTVQFVVSTPESVRAAVESARRMGGYCAGVVLFRWPGRNESLAMQPDEVLEAAGVRAAGGGPGSRVHLHDGACAAVTCVDVYLESSGPLSPRAIRYRIRASAPLEYFLPEEHIPVQMVAPAELEVRMPAYCGRNRLYIGRAVSLRPVEFQVAEEPLTDRRAP